MDALAPAPHHVPAPVAAAPVCLELDLHPGDAAAFWRAPALAAWRHGRRVARGTLNTAWHDTADGALAAEGFMMAEERLGARSAGRAVPRPMPLHPGEAPAAETIEAELRPVGRLEAEVRWLARADAAGPDLLRVACGTLQAGDARRAACRVTLQGGGAEAYGLALALAGALRLAMPRLTLAGEARELGGGIVTPAHLGAPVLAPGGTVDDALATVLRQLGAVLLHWARLAGPDAGEEPVHQMRVALRRLRSALRLFGVAAGCPRLDAAQDELRDLAAILGSARDWDVFAGGLGREAAAAFAGERAVAAMLRAAERQRRIRYAELARALEGPFFRRLCIGLAELAAMRPWRGWIPDDPLLAAQREAALHGDLADFARAALQQNWRRATRAGRGFATRGIDELHGLRIRCKRLRYACELFAPAFPGHGAHRFQRRLASVQDHLGALNDGAAAAGLLAELGGGAGRALAAGLVRGFAAARDGHARAAAARSWKRFRRAQPFWI